MSQPASYDSLQVVVFALGSEEYALPIAKVHEIIRFTEPRSVSAREPWIRGVIAAREDRAGLRPGHADGRHDPAVGELEDRHRRLGQRRDRRIVDTVEDVLTIEGEHIEPSPAGDRELIEAIAKIGDRLIVLLNVEGILAGRSAVATAGVPAAA